MPRTFQNKAGLVLEGSFGFEFFFPDIVLVWANYLNNRISAICFSHYFPIRVETAALT